MCTHTSDNSTAKLFWRALLEFRKVFLLEQAGTTEESHLRTKCSSVTVSLLSQKKSVQWRELTSKNKAKLFAIQYKTFAILKLIPAVLPSYSWTSRCTCMH